MGDDFEIDDPSDWMQTPAPLLAPVEAALRCQVCKDFYDTPMITSCSHTFCSLCIRRCLTNDGKCPTCRAPDQELRLRRNWTVQELTDSFKLARPSLLRLGKDLNAASGDIHQAKGKRKWEESDIGDTEETDNSPIQRRKTRSQTQRYSETRRSSSSSAEENCTSPHFSAEDGLAACPICNKRMKEEEVFPHLDVHTKPKNIIESSSVLSSRTLIPDSTSKHQPPKPPNPLPQLNYSLLKDNALRKKLIEMGISGGGSRALLIRRHTEWVNLVNANFDSSNPRSKRDLLQDLKTWDRYQGAQKLSSSGVVTNNGAVMRKDFDGAAWAAAHNDDFQTLIGKARQKIMAIEIKSPPNDLQKDVILDKVVDDQQIKAEKLDEGDEASYTSQNALLEPVRSEETLDRQSPLLNDEINQSCQLTPATVDLSADS